MRSVVFALLASGAWADEIQTKDGKKIEFKALTDEGDYWELTTPQGTKVNVKKADFDKLIPGGIKEAPLTGASITFDKKRKLEMVDLLSRINPKTDMVNGDWKVERGGLRGQGAPNSVARIHVPFTPPPEYDLTLVVEKKEDTEFIIGLIGGGKQFHMNFEGINNSSNGLGLVDGQMQNAANGTLVVGKVFTKGTPRTVVCMVRTQGVVIQVDGKDYLAWKAQWDKLSVFPAFAVNQPNQLFLGVGAGAYHISRLTLTSPKDK